MKKLIVLLFFAILLGLAGCRSISPQVVDDKRVFAKTADYLQPGGTVYSVNNPKNLKIAVSSFLKRLKNGLSATDFSEKQRQKILRYLAVAEWCMELLGIPEVEAYGKSSVEFVDGWFHNRTIGLAKPKAGGLIWNIFGEAEDSVAQKMQITHKLQDLPREISLAFGGWLRFEYLVNSLRNSGQFGRDLLAYLPEKLTSKNWESNFNGWWDAAIIFEGRTPEESPIKFRLSLPDSRRLLFDWITTIAENIPAVTVSKDFIRLPQVKKGIGPVICWQNGMFCFYESEQTRKRFESPQKRAGELTFFRRLICNLPNQGVAYYLVNIPKNKQVCGTKLFSIATLPPPEKDFCAFGVFSKIERGLLIEENSNQDYNKEFWNNFVELPFNIIGTHSRWNKMIAEPKVVKRKKAHQSSEAHSPKFGECRAQMELLKSGLWNYAAEHSGVFPEINHFGGILELLRGKFLQPKDLICPATKAKPAATVAAFMWENCSYIYFSGWKLKSAAKLPLVVDWPKNHGSYGFNVLFVDGSCETIKMERPVNLRRIVSYLYNRYRYQEADFRSLINQAEEIDKMFGMD